MMAYYAGAIAYASVLRSRRMIGMRPWSKSSKRVAVGNRTRPAIRRSQIPIAGRMQQIERKRDRVFVLCLAPSAQDNARYAAEMMAEVWRRRGVRAYTGLVHPALPIALTRELAIGMGRARSLWAVILSGQQRWSI